MGGGNSRPQRLARALGQANLLRDIVSCGPTGCSPHIDHAPWQEAAAALGRTSLRLLRATHADRLPSELAPSGAYLEVTSDNAKEPKLNPLVDRLQLTFVNKLSRGKGGADRFE